MATPPPKRDEEPPPVMADVLDELHEGDRTRGALADATEWSPDAIGEHLALAEARGYVSNVHESTSLWTLEYDPRQTDADADDAEV